jgi:hypothetical protein
MSPTADKIRSQMLCRTSDDEAFARWIEEIDTIIEKTSLKKENWTDPILLPVRQQDKLIEYYRSLGYKTTIDYFNGRRVCFGWPFEK